MTIFFLGNAIVRGLSPNDAIQQVKAKCQGLSSSSYSPHCPLGIISGNILDNLDCSKTNISVIFLPNNMIFLDDRNELFGVTGILEIGWNTPCTNATETVFHGSINIDNEQWWRPTLSHTNADHDYAMNGHQHRFFLHPPSSSNSSVMFSTQLLGLFSSHCNLNFNMFPMDRQNCTISIVLQEHPSVYQVTTLSQYNGTGLPKIEHFISSSSVWKLMSRGEFCQIQRMSGTERWFCDFWFVLQRKPDYFVINLMLPTVLLSVLQLFVFCLNFNDSNRSVLALTIFLALTFMKTNIINGIPQSSNYSFLSKYSDLCTLVTTLLTAYFLLINFSKVQKSFLKNHLPKVELFSFTFFIVFIVSIHIYAISQFVE